MDYTLVCTHEDSRAFNKSPFICFVNTRACDDSATLCVKEVDRGWMSHACESTFVVANYYSSVKDSAGPEPVKLDMQQFLVAQALHARQYGVM